MLFLSNEVTQQEIKLCKTAHDKNLRIFLKMSQQLWFDIYIVLLKKIDLFFIAAFQINIPIPKS